jgi:hypothetical protein
MLGQMAFSEGSGWNGSFGRLVTAVGDARLNSTSDRVAAASAKAWSSGSSGSLTASPKSLLHLGAYWCRMA